MCYWCIYFWIPCIGSLPATDNSFPGAALSKPAPVSMNDFLPKQNGGARTGKQAMTGKFVKVEKNEKEEEEEEEESVSFPTSDVLGPRCFPT